VRAVFFREGTMIVPHIVECVQRGQATGTHLLSVYCEKFLRDKVRYSYRAIVRCALATDSLRQAARKCVAMRNPCTQLAVCSVVACKHKSTAQNE
jgi:hypothetical protein